METESPAPVPGASSTIQPPARSNLGLAIIAGIAAAVVAAIIWAVVTVETEFQIGYMAIGVGFLVGFAVRLGNGTGPVFGLTGAILALLGCLLGNFFSMIGFVAKGQHMNILSALSAIDLSRVPEIMAATFNPMDLVFYGIAVYEGYRFSQRKPAAGSRDK
jgi:hypothetical protein